LPRRSVAEWSVRAGLAALAGVAGCASVAATLGYMLRNAQPETAHTLAPADGRVTAALARRLSGPGATAAQRARADRLAREALRQDPTTVAAVWTLGINALLRNDPPTASKLLAYGNRLSRRDLQTQVWAIEDAVARNDIPGALRHYDIALRVSRRAPDLLFPILGGAISDPLIRSELIKTLAGRPSWGGIFIDYVSWNGPDARATAVLFTDLRRAGVPIPRSADATLVSTLASRVSMEAAWAHYASLDKGVSRARSRNPEFAATPSIASPFDWNAMEGGGITAAILPDEGGLFDFSAPATAAGPMLQQAQVLPPGDYVLEGRSIGIDQPDGSRPYWSLTCRGGVELGRIEVPKSSQANGNFIGRFTVPTGCPVQTLTLVARTSESISGQAGQIDRAILRPAR
jgi:hypothetical protein